MDQPIRRRYRHRFIHEDAAPCAERMVAGDDQTAPFVPVRDKLEQHPRFCIVTFDITKVNLGVRLENGKYPTLRPFLKQV